MRPLLKLNPYLAKYRWHLMLGTVFIVLSNLFAVYAPQVVREAIDLIAQGIGQMGLPANERVLPVPHTLQLWVGWTGIDLAHKLKALHDADAMKATVVWCAGLLGVVYLVFALLKGLFLFLMRQTIIVVSRLIEFDLKNRIYTHYQQLDRGFYKRNSTGDLMNRISEDVGKVRMYLGPAVMYTINLMVLFVMCIGFMLNVNVELTLWTLAPLPIMSLIIYRVSDVMNRRSMAVQKQQSRLSTLAQESFSGIRVLKSYAKEPMAVERFAEAAADYRKRSMDQAKVDALFMPSIMLLIGLSTVVTIFVGGKKLLDGDPSVTVGNIAEFVIYVNMLTWPFASVGWVTSLVQQASASMERINEFLDARPAVTDADVPPSSPEDPAPIRGGITFRNVSYVYPDTGIRALDRISFQIPAGGTLAVVGHTGCGKSTLAELIGRVHDVTEGEVLIDDVPIRKIPLEHLRSHLGFVPQEVLLFSDTIRNNIAFRLDPGEDLDERVREAAQKAQIHADIEGFPKGYDTLVGERGITLSGGQKQRVSIARAIIALPSILVFDDALSAVDTVTEEAILRALRSVMTGRTTVLISHRISTVRDADLILVLANGRVVEEGTHDRLIGQEGEYARMHQEQLLEEARKGIDL
ncbi:MAG TPA: ABC transporter ATP-binding protein [Flavobacteriales bacterium]|jgi:ATP-binding cassette subfamily B multidrug efflux pump|nr:ABC transporter ATP-binding protein [Flavobacteriales bacterium]MBK6552097.1 ABC transporter ATP-binding protein [Flavobacteriales bacterium]MBK7103172.1 ABC transporter ATP-binding protein [Flavobacteriales bacterium]MBK7112853.1 ABC transporter ATP-binding protein [Flavobacteriales bacterium]MBK7481478.1 ABC transporter ATP-binding protein [Flavobacteriales bacterium]